MVTVPVLSSRMVSTVRVSSRTCGPLIRMPSWAPRPVPVSSPTGVARPRAQGQAMTSTATAAVKAARSSASLTSGPAASSQAPKVSAAMARTTGTKTALMRSASRAIGRLAGLRLGDQPAHLGQGGVGADPGGPDQQPAGGVDGGAGDRAVRTDFDRHRFAGHQRGVDGGGTLDDHAVGGDLLAGADHDDVTHLEPVRGDLLLRAVPQDRGILGAQVQQGLERVAGLLLGVGLQVAAEQQEGGDHGGDLEVQAAGVPCPPCPGVRSCGDRPAAARPRRGRRPSRRWRPACPWWRRGAGH